MSVILTDMDMPKNCYECDLNNYHVCFATGNTIEDYLNESEREPHCPLKSVDKMMEGTVELVVFQKEIN